MQKMECDKDLDIPVIAEYEKIMSEAEGKPVCASLRFGCVDYCWVRREIRVLRARQEVLLRRCHWVCAQVSSIHRRSSETARYANIILQKGCVLDPLP